MPLQVMLSSFWVASTKAGAALARCQGWLSRQGRGSLLAPRDRGPEADVYCLEGHYPSWSRSNSSTSALSSPRISPTDFDVSWIQG